MNMNEKTGNKRNQVSRRKFLKEALLAVSLAIISPAVLLNSCKDPEKTAEETPAVPGKAESNKPAVSMDQSVPPADLPSSSSQAPGPSTSDYSITIDGLVNNSLTLNYDSILQFQSVTKTVTLTCPGVFEETSEWTGVPLRAILTVAGAKPEATQVTVMDSSGYGAPFSTQEQGITSGDIFLAYKYNGQGLPADRGYPLRLVVPGSDGTSWVKGVTHIRLA
jgi:DMSO/TMAO reductase YedYZ molybdopterin-dependent catalytic subunit